MAKNGRRETLDQLREEVASLRREVDQLVQVTKRTSTILVEQTIPTDDIDEMTKRAWTRSRPTPELTWNAVMDGEEFVEKMRGYSGGDLGRILEIGPGYGRLLESILKNKIGFNDYLGIDISAETVAFLTTKFGNEHVSYRHDDFFNFDAPGQFDSIMSSAVFMHFYPSVEPAMRSCHALLAPRGRLYFDVPVGDARYLDVASEFYVRDYRDSQELMDFASAVGYSECAVEEELGFAPGMNGWFVCATK